MSSVAYFDAAAGAPLHPVARQALLAALDDGWVDPGKLYAPARRAATLRDAARATVAEVLGVREDEVWFTAGGAAAVRAAMQGVLATARPGAVLVHSAVEHSAVMHAADRFAAGGGRAVEVPVDRLGRVDLDAWRTAVAGPGVALAVLLSASHEVGTVQPVAEAAAACAAAGVPLLVDAAQSVGRQDVPPGWSLLAGSARKWGGLAGVGVLVVRKGVRWSTPDAPPVLPAAPASAADLPAASPSAPSRPAGEASVLGRPAASALAADLPAVVASVPGLPAVVASAAALRAAAGEAAAEAARLAPLVDRIRSTVAATVPDVEVVGDPEHRLPHLVTFSCLYVDGEALLHALDRRGFAVSSGSSCTSDTLRPSHVLAAMGVLTHGNVRVSLHRESTPEQVDRFLAALPEVVAELRAEVTP